MHIEQGSVIVVSHDEAFVNRLLTGTENGTPREGVRAVDAIEGQLWVLSQKKLNRYNGTFADYKRKILKNIQRKS